MLMVARFVIGDANAPDMELIVRGDRLGGFKKINIPNAKIMIPPPIDHHIFAISFLKYEVMALTFSK